MRCEKMSSFIVMDIVKEAEKFDDCIHFEIGQPDLPPSPKVKDALHVSIDANKFSYTQSHGLVTLREKLVHHYFKTYGVSIDKEQIFLTPGTSGAFLIAYALTLKQGSALGLSDPSYPCYKNFAYLMDINPLFMPIGKADNFELHVKDLRPHKLDALQISSPSNPTGNIYSSENFKEIIEYCDTQAIAFISDELYHGLSYEKEADTALQYSQNVYVINGFSKYYCMPGQRLGWIIVPKNKIRHAEMVAQNLFISAPTLSQYGALEAFDETYLAMIKEEFQKRRDFLYTELSSLFDIDAKPEGAFYIWANISNYSNDSFAFSKELLENIHIATTPGIDFGCNGTKHYVRFAYTRSIEHMSEGVERLKTYLSQRKKMNISKNCVVTLDYTIKDTQGHLLDSGADPLIYLHGGYSDIFEKIEEELDGKKVGDTIEVALSPKESFGEYDKELISVEERSEFDDQIFVGEQFVEIIEEDEFEDEQKISYTIKEITKENVTLDGNHPLAGIDVIFKATILAIRKATAQEIKAEHAR